MASNDHITQTSGPGPDQSFSKAVGAYAGARHNGKHHGSNSTMEGGHRAINSLVSPSSICESYKNVEFFAIKEPYHVVKNKFDVRGNHLK